MRNRWLKTAVLAILSLNLTAGVFAQGADSDVVLSEGEAIFVAPAGSDSAQGSKERPFATIEKAQARASLYKLMGKETVTIYLREGEYDSFLLNSDDSGNENTKIIYKAYPGEEVIITSGLKLEYKGGAGHDEITERIPVKEGIVIYDLSSVDADWSLKGLDNGEVVSMCAGLYADGETMNLARWPDEGYVRISSLGSILNNKISFKNSDKPNLWSENTDAWLAGYSTADWNFNRKKIAGISAGTLTVEGDFKNESRVYFYNIPEELDKPGEYYIDKNTEKLYFYPPENWEEKRIILSIGKTGITVEGCRNVVFDGLTVEGSNGSGIQIEDSEEITVKNCTVRNCAGNGINLSESKNSLADRNHIYNIGGKGITCSQYTFIQNLEMGNITISNNNIHDFGQTTRTYAPGIAVAGVGNTVAHNEIYNYEHTGIMLSGNENVFEYNDLHGLLQSTNDCGAIYCGRTWISRGNVIRYNYIHDCISDAGKSVIGIYLDDMMADVECYGNIIDNVSQGFLMGGGHDNVITNNIIANSKDTAVLNYSIAADSRGTEEWYSGVFDVSGDKTYIKDCIYIKEILNRHCLTSNVWREKYPELRETLTKYFREPQNNTIANNIIYRHWAVNIDKNVIKNGTVENNVMFSENPGFRNPEEGDYSYTGEILEGFLPIPCDKIGITEG